MNPAADTPTPLRRALTGVAISLPVLLLVFLLALPLRGGAVWVGNLQLAAGKSSQHRVLVTSQESRYGGKPSNIFLVQVGPLYWAAQLTRQ